MGINLGTSLKPNVTYLYKRVTKFTPFNKDPVFQTPISIEFPANFLRPIYRY